MTIIHNTENRDVVKGAVSRYSVIFLRSFCASKMATARARVTDISSVSRVNSFTAPAESIKCRFPWPGLVAAIIFPHRKWLPIITDYRDTAALRQDPLEAILVIFGRRALIFFVWKLLEKWTMTPLLCACAMVITLETQKCRKRAPHSVEFNFFNIWDRHKRFSQNERRRIDLQKMPQIFYFCLGT